MAKKFLTSIDLNKNELQNAVVQNLATAPSTPSQGQIYYDSSGGDIQPYYYNGSAWVPWNAADDDFQSLTAESVTANDDEILIWDTSASAYRRQTKANFISGTGGEANTASNQGAGIGVFDEKTGVDLEFRSLIAASTKISIVLDDPNDEIDLDVVPSNIVLSDIGVPTADVDMDSNKIINVTDPTSAQDAATKNYVDTTTTANPIYVAVAGDAMTGALAMGTNKITGLGDPTADQDAATKIYVDNAAQGLSAKDSVVAATTANGTLATAFENGDTLDGVTLVTGERILLKNQSTASENGIYIVEASGAPTRAADFASGDQAAGAFVFVEEGTTNADSGWVCTTDDAADTVGTHDLAFVQFSGAGQITAGNALTKTGNTLDVAPYVGSDANRGQTVIESDTLAVILGTGANNAAAGNHAHAIDDLSDVTITTLSDGELLTSSSGTFINQTFAELGLITKYAADIGNGSLTSITVNHALGTKDVTCQIFDNASTFDQVFADVQHTDTNNLTLIFATAPTTNQYRVVVTG